MFLHRLDIATYAVPSVTLAQSEKTTRAANVCPYALHTVNAHPPCRIICAFDWPLAKKRVERLTGHWRTNVICV